MAAARPVLVFALLAVTVAAPIGCGSNDNQTGAQVKPTEGQAQAQSNMEDFMKNQGNTKPAK